MDIYIGMTGAWWGPLRFAALDLKSLDFKPVRCPSCWSRDCAAVLPASLADRFLLRRLRVPFECRRCGRRFRHFDLAEGARIAAMMDDIDAAVAAGAAVGRDGLPPRSSTA